MSPAASRCPSRFRIGVVVAVVIGGPVWAQFDRSPVTSPASGSAVVLDWKAWRSNRGASNSREVAPALAELRK